MTAEDMAEALRGWRVGSQRMALCLAHDDHAPNLSLLRRIAMRAARPGCELTESSAAQLIQR